MSVLKIRKYGESVIRQKCKPVEEITPEIKKLAADMIETLYAAPGVGLAACQVGVPMRMCVIDVRPGGEKRPIVLINPKIVGREGKSEEEEGCLSFPGMMAMIKRHRKVRVEGINEKGFPVVVEGEDLLGRALQHEIDHLDGKVFIDYLPWWRRRKLEQEARKRKKQGEW